MSVVVKHSESAGDVHSLERRAKNKEDQKREHTNAPHLGKPPLGKPPLEIPCNSIHLTNIIPTNLSRGPVDFLERRTGGGPWAPLVPPARAPPSGGRLQVAGATRSASIAPLGSEG